MNQSWKKKLEIAVKAFNEIGNAVNIYFKRDHTKEFAEDVILGIDCVVAQTEMKLREKGG